MFQYDGESGENPPEPTGEVLVLRRIAVGQCGAIVLVGTRRDGNVEAIRVQIAGFGDLNSDRFNVTVAASAYKDNGSTLADRDSTQNQDFTGRSGGFSLLSPSYWNMADGSAQAVGGCLGGGTTIRRPRTR